MHLPRFVSAPPDTPTNDEDQRPATNDQPIAVIYCARRLLQPTHASLFLFPLDFG